MKTEISYRFYAEKIYTLINREDLSQEQIFSEIQDILENVGLFSFSDFMKVYDLFLEEKKHHHEDLV